MTKTCPICEKEMTDIQELVTIKNVEPPAILHALCHFRASVGLLTRRVAQLELQIDGGNKTVGMLASLLVDLLEYAEMGANWAITNSVEVEPKKIEFLNRRISEAKQVVGKFQRECATDNGNQKPHICTVNCKHK